MSTDAIKFILNIWKGENMSFQFSIYSITYWNEEGPYKYSYVRFKD